MTTIIEKPVKPPPDRSGAVEPLHTITSAAELLGVHAWALRRAVKRGDIPSYTPFNSRKLVRLSEVEAAINASKIGGRNV
jgi:excisionase family DNA binding protein